MLILPVILWLLDEADKTTTDRKLLFVWRFGSPWTQVRLKRKMQGQKMCPEEIKRVDGMMGTAGDKKSLYRVEMGMF